MKSRWDYRSFCFATFASFARHYPFYVMALMKPHVRHEFVERMVRKRSGRSAAQRSGGNRDSVTDSSPSP